MESENIAKLLLMCAIGFLLSSALMTILAKNQACDQVAYIGGWLMVIASIPISTISCWLHGQQYKDAKRLNSGEG